MLLESRLKKLLTKLDLGSNPERNSRILELYLGLDGNGAHTNDEIREIIETEYPTEAVSQERVRVLCNGAQEDFKKALLSDWTRNSFYSNLIDFISSELPIEIGLLEKRLADPLFGTFKHQPQKIKPFTENPFKVDGLVKILKLLPKEITGLEVQQQIVYCGIARKKNKDVRFSTRNTAPSIRFLVNKKQRIDLDQLISHAERSIRFNAMISEQSLVPLMPKSLQVHKREELAHSLVVGHTDFKWLDKELGYFTYTTPDLINNRISKIAMKIFKFCDSINIDLFAHQVSKAVKAPARQLKGESEDPTCQQRSDLLRTISYTGDNPFTTRDALLYFVGAGLCQIDNNGILTPTDLLKNTVEVNVRPSELVMRDVLKSEPNCELSSSIFKESSINRMSLLALEEYKRTLARMIQAGYFREEDGSLLLTKYGFEQYLDKEPDSLNMKRESLASERAVVYEMQLLINGMLKDYCEQFKSELKESRSKLKRLKEEQKKGSVRSGLNNEIVYYEDEVQSLMLLRAELSDFQNREEQLNEAISRINKNIFSNIKKFGEDSIQVRKEQERLKIAKNSLQQYFDIVKSKEKDYLCLEIIHLNEIGLITTEMGRLLDVEVTSSNEISLLQKFVTYKLNYIDNAIENLPKTNDKYEMLVMETYHRVSLKRNLSSGDIISSAKVSTFLNELEADALEIEKQFGLAQYNQQCIYSPVILKLSNGNYTFVGNHNSEYRP